MMHRRQVLKAAGAATLGVATARAMAQQTITLKFHTFMAPSSNLWLKGHKAWMQKIESESGGRIVFQGYPAMQLGGTPAQLFDSVRDGVVDVAWSLPGYTPGRFPRTEVFELPFFTYDGEGASRAAWEYASTHAMEEFGEVRLLAFHTQAPGHFNMRNKLIKSVADLRGLKIRGATRKCTQLLGSVGAIPVGMPLPQITDAVSKGVVDGAVLPWEVMPSVKLHELTTFHSEFRKGHPGLYNSTCFMFMNKEKYAALPADLKQVIDRNSGLETSAFLGKLIQDNDPAARKMALDRGNTIHVIDGAEAEEFVKRSASLEAGWAKEVSKPGVDGAKLLQVARDLVEKYRVKA